VKSFLKIILIALTFIPKAYSQDTNLYTIGKEEFLTGNYSMALNNLLKATTNEKDLDYLIAMSYFNLKKYTDAAIYFTKDINENKTNLNSYMKRAESNKQLGQFELALEDLNSIIKIDKNYFLAYFEIGNLNFDKKEYKQAIAEYNKAIAIRSNFEKAFYKIGFCYLNLKDTKQACTYWKKIEDLDDFEEHKKIEEILNKNLK
jgi:tetratricopeptide (TPR) repeat protein